jgi:hypothetical protein
VQFLLALFAGNGLGLAADWCRARGSRWGVAVGVVALLAAFVGCFLLTSDYSVVTALFLILGFVTGYLGLGQTYLRRRRSTPSDAPPGE